VAGSGAPEQVDEGGQLLQHPPPAPALHGCGTVLHRQPLLLGRHLQQEPRRRGVRRAGAAGAGAGPRVAPRSWTPDSQATG
jgi:hypothetical protein